MSYSWDKDGNLTAYGSNSLTYDAADHWTSGTIGGTSVAYAYDGEGRRVSRTDNGTDTTKYWYDLRGMSYETGTTASTYDLALDGTPLSIYHNSALKDYAHDRLGSTRNLVTTSQSIVRTLAYDPYGLTTIDTGSPYTGPRFTGVYQDDTTDLYRMDARFYQAGRGRFTQIDPLPKSLISWDRYAYTGCDPVNATDRSGLDDCLSAYSYVYGTAVGVLLSLSGGLAVGLVLAGVAIAVSLDTISTFYQCSISGAYSWYPSV